MHLNRRKFIIGSVATVSAVGTAGLIAPSSLLTSPESFIREVDSRLYDTKLGQTYVEGKLKGQSKHGIFRKLSSKITVFDWLSGRTALTHALQSEMENDYRNDRILTVNGWIMPETAVYLSALAYLAPPDVH
jgi:hypothetical protein